jgi:hypothetical protein
MPPSPYRTPEPRAPEPPEARLGLGGTLVFVWLVTVARIAMSAGRAEAPSRELALAWVLAIALPILLVRWIVRRRVRPPRRWAPPG